MNVIKANGHYIISALAIGGIALAAMSFSGPPLFSNLDQFVLFAQEEIKLEHEVQISSGDLGSNDKLDIEKDAIVNGNLFANKISIDKNSIINGNVSYNQLKTQKEAQILGTQTKPVSLPIANLPNIPDFQLGTQDFKFQGQNNTLAAGSYRDIILEKDSRLTLTGGVYNLSKLELKDNSILIFNAPATLNVQFKLKGQQRVSILPGANNLSVIDLAINYIGIKPKKEKPGKEDDDNEIEELLDSQEKNDLKDGKMGRPIVFGKNSFLNFKLLAPKAAVHIGQDSTIRGQILARKIKIEKDSILSLEQTTIKISKPEDIITDLDGGVYPINTLLVYLTPDATFENALKVAQVINGRVVGNVSSINLYQIEVQTRTIEELENLISTLRNRTDLKIDGIFRDFVFPEQ